MNKNTFSNRVTWYNFILCIFVVWIHAQNTDLFTEVVMIEGKPLFNQIEQTMVSDIAVVGVAGFFLCSGYLFYRNYSWGKVLEKYMRHRAKHGHSSAAQRPLGAYGRYFDL